MSKSNSDLSIAATKSLNEIDASMEPDFLINEAMCFLNSMIFEGVKKGYLNEKRDEALNHLKLAKGFKRWDKISENIQVALNKIYVLG